MILLKNKKLLHTTSWIGAIIILISYLFLTLGIFESHSFLYHISNIIGSLLLLLEVFIEKNYGSSFLQLAWILIAFIGIIQIFTL